MKVIQHSHLAEIERKFSLSNRVFGDYTTDQNHWATRWIMSALLSKPTGETVSKDDLQVLNIYSGIFYIMADKISNGVGQATMPGEVQKYSGTAHNATDLVSTGFTAIEIVSDGEKKQIQVVPSNELVIDTVPTRYVYIVRRGSDDKETTYLFRKRYYVGYNTNELFKLDKGSKTEGIPAEFSELGLDYLPREATGLTTLSVFWGATDCMFKIAQGLVFAFERNLVDIETQFYKHLEAWLLMKGIRFSSEDRNEDGTIKKERIRQRVISTESPDAAIEYVSMSNPALTELIDFTSNKIIRLISAVTSIPSFYFGIEDSVGSYGEDATALRLQDFRKKCQKYQSIISDIFDKALKSMGVTDGSIIWGEPIEKANSQLLDEYAKAVELGIISKRRMVMEYWDMSEQEADKYIAEIASEQSAVVATASTVTV